MWFVDNEAAVSSLIRGTSRSGDVGHIAAIAQLRLLQLGASPWFEWIDSHSNPADGLSRDGLADEWTAAQGLLLKEWSAADLDRVLSNLDQGAAEQLLYFGETLGY